jgi:arginase
MRRIAVLDAPSNLGLRPPTATSVPGCAKAPGALRDHGLVARLGARDAGCVTPARYDPAGWQPGDGVAQSDDIAVFVKRLADRIGTIIAAGEFPLVLGGDCSILLGAGLAMRRHSSVLGGHVGLVYVDGHSDFRHQGNTSYVGAAAGEALALATGRGQSNLAAIEHRRPYFRDVDVVLLGIRTHDEYRLDLQAAGIASRPVPELRSDGAARSAQWARTQLADCAGYWVHVDVDVLDPAVMPAVDAPDVGGIAYTELELLLNGLVATPRCLGLQVTVFDPDYDPDAVYAREVADTLVAGLGPLVSRPPIVLVPQPPAVQPPTVQPPAVAEPAVAEPVEVEPTVVDPVEVEPSVVEPSVVEPSVVESGAVETAVVELVPVGSGSTDGASLGHPLEEPPPRSDDEVSLVGQPADNEPRATDPLAADPLAVEPFAAEPDAERVAAESADEPLTAEPDDDFSAEPPVDDDARSNGAARPAAVVPAARASFDGALAPDLGHFS